MDGSQNSNAFSANPSSSSTSRHGTESPTINVSIHSVMQGVDNITVTVRRDASVRDLKNAFLQKKEIRYDKQALIYDGKELKDDDAALSDYGIVNDCTVHLTPKMASGTRERNPAPSTGGSGLILIIPSMMSSKTSNSETDLRDLIRSMHTLNSPGYYMEQPPPRLDPASAAWSAEKQMEHELTRNRMKQLLQRRQKQRGSSTDALPSQSPRYVDTGSVCGSVGRSPMGSEPGTPPPEQHPRSLSPTISAQQSTSVVNVEVETPVTVKEFGAYFDPPESHRQVEIIRRDLYDPPQNREEMAKIKEELARLQKTLCGVCRRKLPLARQSAVCSCQRSFCTRHSNPEAHNCSMDYKHVQRAKLQKENPKIDEGGARKAKANDKD
ncbi:Protein F56F3.4 [Aphelenchoides avenae]|nr:Protein F56F3.4 [Aphelenchus avenae]